MARVLRRYRLILPFSYVVRKTLTHHKEYKAADEKALLILMISRDEAIELVSGLSRFSHLLMVSAMMKKLAERFGENGKKWELTGLLHDLDIDDTQNDMSKHGVIAAERLEGKLPEICLHAIRAHDFRTGVIPMSKLDKALIAVDSVAVLVER